MSESFIKWYARFLALIAHLFCRCRHWVVRKYVGISNPQRFDNTFLRDISCGHAAELTVQIR